MTYTPKRAVKSIRRNLLPPRVLMSLMSAPLQELPTVTIENDLKTIYCFETCRNRQT
jgi:hypothetical protein